MKLLLTLVLLFSALFGSVDDDIKTFVKDFKSKRSEAKYYKELKSLDKEKLNKILKRYKQTIQLINPNNIPEEKLTKELQRSLNNNVKYIIKFYDALNSSPKAEEIAIKHEKKVPELQGSKVIEFEKKEGKVADLKAKVANAKKDIILNKYNKEIKQLDKDIVKIEKELAKNKKELAKNEKELAKILKELHQLLK